jgi:hypothetical protein
LDMRKLSAKWVPKCLNADQKRQRCQSSEQILDFFYVTRRPKVLLGPIVNTEQNLLKKKGPEYKQQ